MSPIFSSGANTADRVPTTTRASPFRTRHHSRARSTSLSAECSTATPSNRAPNHDRHCRPIHKVSAISGTSTSAVLPHASVFCTARKYTSVFPLPVTPCSSCTPNSPRANRARIPCSALSCSAFNSCAGGEYPASNGSSAGSIASSQLSTIPPRTILSTPPPVPPPILNNPPLLRRDAMCHFTTHQAPRRFTPRLRQNNLALRFQFRHRRQHRAKHFAHRRQVIPRDPVRQLDQFRRQRRNKIQHARELANLRSGRRALRQFHNDAHHRLLPERHKDAAPRLHRSIHRFRHRVRERLSQRHGQRDIAKRRSHPAV